jgi:hypothetical protein
MKLPHDEPAAASLFPRTPPAAMLDIIELH